MEFFIARRPVFNRRREIFGYELYLCQSMREHYNAYSKPDDAEELYRLLCFAGFNESPNQPKALLAFSDKELESPTRLLPPGHVIVKCGSSGADEASSISRFEKIKSLEYQLAYDIAENCSRPLAELSDFISIDFSAHSLDFQMSCMESMMEINLERTDKITGKMKFLACNVDTWEDFEKAYAIGYSYFQGNFYLKPLPEKRSDIRSFNTTILRVISELGGDKPRYKEISNIIEHDLNLSYGLLKLVNSAYIAPRFKVKTISQAVTVLGLNELNKFMSAMILKEAQSPENIELLRCSVIRGKLVELLADRKNITQKGSEAFFTGMFSLIDVILNKKMEEILSELPLTVTVKDALSGKNNDLKKLLDMVVDYEKADWDSFISVYKLDIAAQEELLNLYLAALTWAESLDFY